jgi:thioredoxin-dependent peroxiredoxin
MNTETGKMPQKGDRAPDFEGVTQTGDTVRLSDYRGQKVALYFYPKDDTPGCTKQACSLRDGYGLLKSSGITILGVSADPVTSHVRFAEKYALPFPLIADPEHEILNRYGVWGEKSMYGRKYMGTHRTTFLIDEKGHIQQVITKPEVKDHANEIIAAWQ